MKKFFTFLFNNLGKFIFLLIVFFLLGYFSCHIRNNYKSYYTATFSMENNEVFNESALIDEEYLITIRDGASKYENINVKKMIKKNGFSISCENNIYTVKTGYRFYETFFINSSKTVSTRAKMFVKDSVTGINNNVVFENNKDIVVLNNHLNEYIFGLYFVLCGIIFNFLWFGFLYFKNKDKESDDIVYDNITCFRTVFHRNYWEFPIKKAKDITMVSMLFAIMIACKFIPIPSGFGDLGLSFTFLFFSMIGLLYGPEVAFIIGIFSDVIGFFINSTGVFNAGYTLQAALTGAIYGFCFYKTKVDFSKVLLARILVNFLMNVLFGSFLYATTFCESPWFSNEFMSFMNSYMVLYSLPKNIFYLLPQSILLFATFKLVFPIFKKERLISENVYKHFKAI